MLTPQDILAIRKSLGLTPTQFAARLGKSASTICLWESGKRHPRYDMMVELNKLRDEADAASAKNGKAKKAQGVATA